MTTTTAAVVVHAAAAEAFVAFWYVVDRLMFGPSQLASWLWFGLAAGVAAWYVGAMIIDRRRQ